MTREELLMLFTDKVRRDIKTPFTMGDYTWATNTYTLLFLPKQEGDNYPNNGTIQPYFSMIEKQTRPITYSLQDLKDLLGEKVMQPVYEEIKCEDCDGLGKVEFEYFSPIEKDFYYLDHECPVCNGSKIKEGDKIGEEACYKPFVFKIKNATFNSEIFKCIIDVCEFYSESVFHLVSKSNKHKEHLFKVNEAYVLIMPFVSFEEELDNTKKVKTLNPKP